MEDLRKEVNGVFRVLGNPVQRLLLDMVERAYELGTESAPVPQAYGFVDEHGVEVWYDPADVLVSWPLKVSDE